MGLNLVSRQIIAPSERQHSASHVRFRGISGKEEKPLMDTPEFGQNEKQKYTCVAKYRFSECSTRPRAS